VPLLLAAAPEASRRKRRNAVIVSIDRLSADTKRVVTSAAFSLDGERVVTALEDNTAHPERPFRNNVDEGPR